MEANDALTRHFYLSGADDFMRARTRPWHGWDALLAACGATWCESTLRVLDVGGGHGRFGAFLEARGVQLSAYDVVDRSPMLLAAAAARGARAVCADLSPGRLPALSGTYDLVVLQGLLHHLPRPAARAQLLSECAALGCVLFASFWCLPLSAPLSRRGRQAPGGGLRDRILPFSGSQGTYERFCHLFDDAEVRDLLAPFPESRTFCGVGRDAHNRYAIVWPTL